MKRRTVIALVAGIASVPSRATAQTAQPRRIGFLSLRSRPGEYDAAFRDGLRQLGYIEGRTIDIDYRWGAGNVERTQALAVELASRKVEIIVAATTVAVRAAMKATQQIPIIIAIAADPVGSGLVSSLSRPTANVTGMTLISTETGAKRLQIVRDLLPAIRRVAVLLADRGGMDDGPINRRLLEQLRLAADEFRITLIPVTIARPAELEAAFASFRDAGAQALIIPANSLVIDNRQRVVDLAAAHRLPAIYEVEEFVAAGGLLSFGPDLADMYRRAATFVDRILKGMRPSSLPVEQPTTFRIAINLGTAAALGLMLPPTLQARADRVLD